MKEYAFTLKLQSIPPVLLREKQALILLVNGQGNFILGQKNHYPAGISRLIGGGIENTEDPQTGAAREVQEEIGISIPSHDLKPLAHIRASIFLESPKSPQPATDPIHFESFIYLLEIGDAQLKPDSDLDELLELTEEEFQDLIKKYSQLETTIQPPATFSWHDYGQYFALVHEVALAEYKHLQHK